MKVQWSDSANKCCDQNLTCFYRSGKQMPTRAWVLCPGAGKSLVPHPTNTRVSTISEQRHREVTVIFGDFTEWPSFLSHWESIVCLEVLSARKCKLPLQVCPQCPHWSFSWRAGDTGQDVSDIHKGMWAGVWAMPWSLLLKWHWGWIWIPNSMSEARGGCAVVSASTSPSKAAGPREPCATWTWSAVTGPQPFRDDSHSLEG